MYSANAGADESPFASVVVGGGPGGLGPLLWAAQNGLLDAWLAQGVAVVERTGRLGGTLGRYGICSDSLGGSYLECLEPEALTPSFHYLRNDPITFEMRRYRQSFPPLPLVDRYMGRIGEAMTATLALHRASALHFHTTVQSIHLRADGTVALFARGEDARPRTLIARSAIVALGGRQPWQEKAPESGLCFPDNAERRIAVLDIVDFGPAGLRTLLDEAALVAPCLGYRAATLPIVDESGRRLALRADANGDAVGDDCRLVLGDGGVLPNVYCIGLGTGFRPSLAMGCEPNFSGQANSLWLYQNDIGATIYRGIHEKQAALAAA